MTGAIEAIRVEIWELFEWAIVRRGLPSKPLADLLVGGRLWHKAFASLDLWRSLI